MSYRLAFWVLLAYGMTFWICHTKFFMPPYVFAVWLSRISYRTSQYFFLQNLGMTLTWKVIPTSHIPYDLSFESHTFPLHLLHFTHIHRHCSSFGFQVLTPKLAGYDLFKCKNLLVTVLYLVFRQSAAEILNFRNPFWRVQPSLLSQNDFDRV